MDLSGWIDRHADFTPGKAALVFEDRVISYRDFSDRIKAAARALKAGHRIGRGDRVAYLGLNSPEFLVLFFACARLGAMFLPLNWRLAEPEHRFMLQDAQAKLLICEQAFKDHAAPLRTTLPDCAFAGSDFSDAGWPGLEDPGPEASDRNPHVDLNLPFLLVYTSGTTGHPKGAVLRQEAIFWNALNSLHMHDMTAGDKVLTVLPMFHVGGLNIQTTPALYAGATVVLHAKFDPVQTAEAISRQRPSLTVLVPATIRALLGLPDWESLDLDCLRSLTTGSSVVPLDLIEAVHSRGIPVLQVYGSTETCPIAIYLKPQDAFTHAGSTGKPGLHCNARIVDDAFQDVPAGEPGELAVSGPNVMYEYWGNPDATSQSLKDGWFLTGDVGFKDSKGFYHVHDRKKDLIISGGENIYSAELELVLNALPEVQQAVVVPRADPKWGQVPVAVVALKDGSLATEAELLGCFEGQIARFKHPKDVILVPSLPVNAMGKVQKFAVREMIAELESKTNTKVTQ